MIEVPYYTPGVGFDEESRRAGTKRAFYYGSGGFVDPRTWTLDPALFYVHHRRHHPHLLRRAVLKSAFAGSMRMAFMTSVVMAVGAYLGMDPFDVTPGYGMTPTNQGLSIDGESHSASDMLRFGLDTTRFYM